MTSNDDLFRDTFDNLSSVVAVPTIDESVIQSETLLVAGDSCKEVDDGGIPLIDAPTSDVLATRSAYVLTLPKDSLAALQGTLLTLPLVKTTERHFLNATEPALKKKKVDLEEEQSVKEMLGILQKTLMDRLQSIENKLIDVSAKCQNLEGKVNDVLEKTRNSSVDSRHAASKKGRTGPFVVGVPSQISADYPDGSWLGDPNNPDMRVRCNISLKDLEYCNRMCTTPEKMSLTLLDCLFDREVQACSNISGTGRHGKKQLDPLKIYGIRCHLTHIFGITDKDWHRIRQNLDSKCRTAFRRKQKGMPLTVKGFRERPQSLDDQDASNHSDKCSQTAVTPTSVADVIAGDFSVSEATSPSTKQCIDSDTIIPIPLKIEASDIDTISLQIQGITESQIIHTEHGDIQVLHATPEQLAALKEGHDLQILADANILSEMRIHDVTPS